MGDPVRQAQAKNRWATVTPAVVQHMLRCELLKTVAPGRRMLGYVESSSRQGSDAGRLGEIDYGREKIRLPYFCGKIPSPLVSEVTPANLARSKVAERLAPGAELRPKVDEISPIWARPSRSWARFASNSTVFAEFGQIRDGFGG